MFLNTSDAELLVTSYGHALRTIVAHGGWVGSGELWAAPLERLSQSWRTVTYVIVGGRYTGARTPARDRLVAGCKADFRATMEAFVNACTPETACDAERAWGKLIVNRSNAVDAVQVMECVEGVDLEPRLASITLPTLVLHGRQDVIVPLASSERLAELVAGSKLVVAEDAGHVPTVTRPEWDAREINAFFPCTA